MPSYTREGTMSHRGSGHDREAYSPLVGPEARDGYPSFEFSPRGRRKSCTKQDSDLSGALQAYPYHGGPDRDGPPPAKAGCGARQARPMAHLANFGRKIRRKGPAGATRTAPAGCRSRCSSDKITGVCRSVPRECYPESRAQSQVMKQAKEWKEEMPWKSMSRVWRREFERVMRRAQGKK